MSKLNDIISTIRDSIADVYTVIDYLNLSEKEKIYVLDTAEVISDKLDNLKSADVNFETLSLMK